MMTWAMPAYASLHLETQADCNRRCPTCLRQSYPDRSRLTSRQAATRLATETVLELLDYAANSGFRGRVCLSHYNEPLLDDRIGQLGRYARQKGCFAEVYLNTNGDRLTAELAAELDGAFDRLHITLYGAEQDERAGRYAGWFRQTTLDITPAAHLMTHYSPTFLLRDAIQEQRDRPCIVECQQRLIIAHDGQMRLCCDDIAGEWRLGDVYTQTLDELWYGDQHREIVATLAQPGGRRAYAYCSECPRD